MSIRKWKFIRAEEKPNLPLFDANIHWLENPRNHVLQRTLILRAPESVNVIALTSDFEVLLVEQFRFGIGQALLELPAGLVDEGEEPLDAAKRELLEETGYVTEKWMFLGVSYINPAYVSNSCHHFLALDVRVGHSIDLDQTEDLSLRKVKMNSWDHIFSDLPLQDGVGFACLHHLKQYYDLHLRGI